MEVPIFSKVFNCSGLHLAFALISLVEIFLARRHARGLELDRPLVKAEY